MKNKQNLKRCITAMAMATAVATTSMVGPEIPYNISRIEAATKEAVTFEFAGYTYEIMEDGLHVCMTGFVKGSTATEVVVPEEVTFENHTYAVTQIKNSAFENNNKITKITIGKNVTTIEKRAFGGCMHISSITLPESVEVIEEEAFSGCLALTEIKLPSKLNTLGKKSFAYCGKLTSVTIPKSVKKVMEDDFSSESKSPFFSCDKLVDVTFEDGMTEIPDFILDGVVRVENIHIPESVISIGQKAFCNVWMKNIKLPSGLTTIKMKAFAGCKKLEEIQFPDSLQVIERNSFQECNSLTEVTIPASVTSTNAGPYHAASPFYQCIGLKKVVFSEGMKSLPANILDSADYVEEVILPSTLKKIEKYAFRGCSKLASIQLPEGLEAIEQSAFQGAILLKEIKLPSTLTTMEEYVFFACEGIKEVTIPASLTNVSHYASPFYECRNLTKVTFEEGMETIPYGILENVPSVTTVSLPGTVTKIDEEAFYGATGLTDVAIPNGVTKIGRCAFYNTSIKGIILPDALKQLGGGAFMKCPNLEYIRINSNIDLNNTLFDESEKLKNIEISSNVTMLSDYIFKTYLGDYVIIPGSVSNIEKECYREASNTYTIYGVSGTASEAYATENKIKFSDISGAPAIQVPEGVSTPVPATGDALQMQAPASSTPASSTPASSTPASSTPASSTPASSTPASSTPASSTPASSAPVSSAPATKVPATKAPTTVNSVKKPKKVSISLVKRTGTTKAKITWKKLAGVNGYEIVYSTSDKFKAKTTKKVAVAAGKTAHTLSKLKKNTKYYIKIRAYKKNSVGKKIYGSYSSKKIVGKK